MNSSDRASRIKYFDQHLRNWSNRVHDVTDHILAQDDASGKIGLPEFSNGGFLAVLSAASDPRVSALVVFYGGIAGPKAEIARLPPLLALHGDADRVIPIAAGAALVERARALGGPAELVTYPGAGHVFDFDQTRDDARDASDRALSFMQNQLKWGWRRASRARGMLETARRHQFVTPAEPICEPMWRGIMALAKTE